MAEKFPKEIYLQGNLRLDQETTKRKDARFHDKIYKDPGPTQRPNNSIPLTEFIQEKIDNEEIIIPEQDCDCDSNCESVTKRKFYVIPENFTNRISETIIYEKENIPFESAHPLGTSLQFRFYLMDNSGVYFYKNTLVYIDVPNGSYFADLKTQLLNYIEEVTIYLTDTFPDLDINYIVEDIIHEGKPAIKIKIENNNELYIDLSFSGKSGQNLINRPSDIIGFVHNNSYSNLYTYDTSSERIYNYLPTKFTINTYTVYPDDINYGKTYIEENEEDPIIKLTLGNYHEGEDYNAGELFMTVPIEEETILELKPVCDILENHEDRIIELENSGSSLDLLKTLPGYNNSETQTLKNVAGAISWVTD